MGSAGPPPARNARLSRGARTGRSESGGVTSHERAYKTKAQPAPNLCRLCHPLSTCRLASRWKEDMAFLRRRSTQHPRLVRLPPQHTPSPSVRGPALSQCEWLA